MLLKEFLGDLPKFVEKRWVSSPKTFKFPAKWGNGPKFTGINEVEDFLAMAEITLCIKADFQNSSNKDINLEKVDGQVLPVVSFSGTLYALFPKGEKVELCGCQCDEDILDFFNSCPQEITKENGELLEILQLWRRWHLNDLCAGSNIQKEALLTWEGYPEADYKASCDYLESIGLLEERGYKYGHAWLFERVPNEVLNQLTDIFKEEGELKNEDI